MSKNTPEIEAVQLTSNDLSLTPSRFEVEGKPMYLAHGWTWGFLERPGKSPITHLRQFSDKNTTDIGFIEMAETPLRKPSGVHVDDLYPQNSPLEYMKVKGDPEGLTNDMNTYEQRIDGTAMTPKLLYRYSSKYARAIEGNVLDVTYEYMPYAMVVNANGALGSPYIHQHAVIKGTYEGKPVTYLGGWDRIYFKEAPVNVARSDSEDFLSTEQSEDTMFAGVSFAGIRQDGCREWGFMGLVNKRCIGYYCKDGDKPIAVTEVEMEPYWERLPYVNDSTMIFTKATFRFANKEIHYDAKWGCRGHNPKLPSEKWWPGFSQTGGTWYEGSKPYEHVQSFVFAESRNALETNVKKNYDLK